MSVHSSPLAAASKLSSNQAAGVVIWLISAYATSLFVQQIGIAAPVSYAFGFAIQYIFTLAEQPIWRRQGYPMLGIIVTGVDTLLNAVGIWPYVRDRFGATDLWGMVTDLTHDPSEPTLLVRGLIVAVIGLAVAAGPEYFMSRKN